MGNWCHGSPTSGWSHLSPEIKSGSPASSSTPTLQWNWLPAVLGLAHSVVSLSWRLKRNCGATHNCVGHRQSRRAHEEGGSGSASPPGQPDSRYVFTSMQELKETCNFAFGPPSLLLQHLLVHLWRHPALVLQRQRRTERLSECLATNLEITFHGRLRPLHQEIVPCQIFQLSPWSLVLSLRLFYSSFWPCFAKAQCFLEILAAISLFVFLILMLWTGLSAVLGSTQSRVGSEVKGNDFKNRIQNSKIISCTHA